MGCARWQSSPSDADVWMAYTLLEAGAAWNEPRYTALGASLAQGIVEKEVIRMPSLGPVLLPGPTGFQKDESVRLTQATFRSKSSLGSVSSIPKAPGQRSPSASRTSCAPRRPAVLRPIGLTFSAPVASSRLQSGATTPFACTCGPACSIRRRRGATRYRCAPHWDGANCERRARRLRRSPRRVLSAIRRDRLDSKQRYYRTSPRSVKRSSHASRPLACDRKLMRRLVSMVVHQRTSRSEIDALRPWFQ